MSGETHDRVWPLPKFYFKIEIPPLGEALFQEVSGLDMEAQIMEYSYGDSKEFSAIKIPGIKKYSVTLKKGVFKTDNTFWDWFNQFKMNTIGRQLVIISLLDEKGKAIMVWELKNAWPTRITTLNSDGKEIAVATLVLAHEGITIKNR